MKVSGNRNSVNYKTDFGAIDLLRENPGVKSGLGYFVTEFTLRVSFSRGTAKGQLCTKGKLFFRVFI